ncbi:hypothetical protein N0B31_15460 [Salinirubellus salinus]|uniref:Uncharacterized protein n=1 Tax=Salinirubellus salinus TaxID=1364945 RepID=A0A9E7R2P3_9EURY|nr:hypothetical protein [Salinirubellus salinus]UWM53530.1 hypothetical protein N0B31_15460 [Salinirubellus salinus]
MDVRDAVEADAERLAELTGAPTDVMRNLVHDRTVRVAVEREGDSAADSGGEDGGAADENEPGERAPGEERVVGFVSFDAQRKTVHVTQMEGPEAATRRLLEEPRRFAANEGMSVELLVAADEESHRSVAEAVGFAEEGPGPRFDGTATVRYRLDP